MNHRARGASVTWRRRRWTLVVCIPVEILAGCTRVLVSSVAYLVDGRIFRFRRLFSEFYQKHS